MLYNYLKYFVVMSFLLYFEVWISQLLLKQHESVIVAAERPEDAWTWRLCRLLHMNIGHLAAATQQANNRESLAVSLRTVEVFTSWEISQRILGESKVMMMKLWNCRVTTGLCPFWS